VCHITLHLKYVHSSLGNSLDKLRHSRSVAYSAGQVLLNKHQIWSGGAYPDCYPSLHCRYVGISDTGQLKQYEMTKKGDL